MIFQNINFLFPLKCQDTHFLRLATHTAQRLVKCFWRSYLNNSTNHIKITDLQFSLKYFLNPKHEASFYMGYGNSSLVCWWGKVCRHKDKSWKNIFSKTFILLKASSLSKFQIDFLTTLNLNHLKLCQLYKKV